jgi:radical SAM-linked protein
MKFSKTGTMRFIGHLDVMRYFQRLMRRAQVDIRYSEGFSPHQIMSFAQPLGVGDTTEGDYVDIDVLSTEDSETMIRRINACSSPEIQVLSYVQIADETRRSNAMANIAAADYRITEKRGTGAIDQASFAAMMEQETIPVIRKTKTKEQEVDIKPLILSWQVEDGALLVKLSTGSLANCKPDTLMDAYDRFCKREPVPFRYHFHRLEMYANREGEWIPLDGLGTPVGTSEASL